LGDNHKWENYYRGSRSEEKFGIKMRPSGLGDLHLCMQDAIIAAQNTVLAAEALGLGSCYIGDIVENYERLRDLLNLPSHACPACMLIMGYPQSTERKPSTPRPPVDGGVFMTDGYKDLSFEELEYQYSNHTQYNKDHKRIPLDGSRTTADEYFGRKYTSDFMEEMNRSTSVFMTRWVEEQE
ncbi:MAG: nitroreductase family protein, partial [Spirochaetales bacterium]|nr:nitroreductase family protein [Candidatus Physcosoma equi]